VLSSYREYRACCKRESYATMCSRLGIEPQLLGLGEQRKTKVTLGPMRTVVEKSGTVGAQLIVQKSLELAAAAGLEVSRIWFQEPLHAGDQENHVLTIAAAGRTAKVFPPSRLFATLSPATGPISPLPSCVSASTNSCKAGPSSRLVPFQTFHNPAVLRHIAASASRHPGSPSPCAAVPWAEPAS
jgi:hypothetical protein